MVSANQLTAAGQDRSVNSNEVKYVSMLSGALFKCFKVVSQNVLFDLVLLKRGSLGSTGVMQ